MYNKDINMCTVLSVKKVVAGACHVSSLGTFKSQLKTYLFKQSYDCH